MQEMKYEDLYDYTGQMGRYQWTVFASVFFFIMYTVDAIHMFFIGGEMPHWCRVRELEDLSYGDQKNVAIPGETQEDGSVEYSSCEMYAFNYSIYNDSDFLSWNRSVMVTNSTEVVQCTEWMYDQSTFTSTIVSRFDLVCGWGFLNQLPSSLFMFGALIGGLSGGFLSDKFGRKKVMLGFSCLKIFSTALSVFATSYIPFAVARALVGIGTAGFHGCSFVLVMELVGPYYRTGLGCALHLSCSVGFMLQPAIAYVLRDEFSYHLAATAPVLLFPFITLFFIPESPRWLTVHGQYDEALKVVRHMCKVNGTKLPEDFHPAAIYENKNGDVVSSVSSLPTKRKIRSSLPRFRPRAVIIHLSWFTCSLVYYSMSLNTGTLSGSIYLNTFICGAVEVPALILSILLMNWKPLGRRWTGCLGLIGAGISSFICIPLILLNWSASSTTMAMFGKAFICIPTSVCFIITAEIFPTETRNAELGIGNLCARISSMAAPYVGGPLGTIWKPLPSLVFGMFATLSGLLYICLPETLGRPLFDTLEQEKHYERLCGKKHRSTSKADENGVHGKVLADLIIETVVQNGVKRETDGNSNTISSS